MVIQREWLDNFGFNFLKYYFYANKKNVFLFFKNLE